MFCALLLVLLLPVHSWRRWLLLLLDWALQLLLLLRPALAFLMLCLIKVGGLLRVNVHG